MILYILCIIIYGNDASCIQYIFNEDFSSLRIYDCSCKTLTNNILMKFDIGIGK